MNLPDIPRFYTALAEWMACMIYILPLRGKMPAPKLIVGSVGALFFQSFFLCYTEKFPIYLWIPCMLAAVFFMYIYICVLGRLNIKSAVYTTVRAFGLAELAASLEWQIHCHLWVNDLITIKEIMLLTGVYAICFGGMIWLEKRYTAESGCLEMSKKEVISALIIGIAVFTISNVSFVTANSTDSVYGLALFNTRTLVDLGGVAILFAHYILCCELRDRQKIENMERILQNQYLQYQQSKENVELINHKYHDLKHQIEALKMANDEVQRNQYLEQMEAEIKKYEVENKTGNPVLDTILTSKSQKCLQEKIEFTSVADGTLLEFMDIMDICSVFGNILDNAIEYEENVTDIEKRLIHLSVSQYNNFLLIRCENYCADLLDFEQGLPRSTKGNLEFHGYGLKSVRHVVEKYEGTLTITAKKNWFTVKILIPIL